MNERSILHVDMDAFYAAIEQRDRPELQGVPVIIAHTGPRGVVSTASYEAREFGVRSAMPTAVALKRCPHGIYIEPRLAYYAAVSKQIFSVFETITPEIEGLSLDEAFLDVTHSRALLGTSRQMAAQIKREVLRVTGLKCSVGCAHNKLLAKMASELCKPNGLLEILPSEVRARLDALPCGKLYTVGRVAEQALADLGIKTIAQLRAAKLSVLQRALGNQAEQVLRFANGVDDRPVRSDRLDKSLGAEHTFGVDLQTIAEAKAELMRLCERVATRARAHGLKGSTVTVKLRVPPFETSTRQCTLSAASDATTEIYQHADRLLQIWWKGQSAPKLRLLGVSLSQLEFASEMPIGRAQLDLFAAPRALASVHEADELSDRINQRFGAGALRRGCGLEK